METCVIKKSGVQVTFHQNRGFVWMRDKSFDRKARPAIMLGEDFCRSGGIDGSRRVWLKGPHLQFKAIFEGLGSQPEVRVRD